MAVKPLVSPLFTGSFTALITPMKENGSLDEEFFRILVRSQIEAGSDGIVCAGSTGESATLTFKEKLRLFEIGVEEGKGKLKVLAGTGVASTWESVELTAEAKKIGVDGCLVITPYYIKPNMRGIFLHMEKILGQGLPAIVYYNPTRTGKTLYLDDLLKLASMDGVVGIKEASGDMGMTRELIARSGVSILAGDDPLTLPYISMGGHGVISVIGNVAPHLLKRCVESATQGEGADEEWRDFASLLKALSLDVNPIGIKYATALKFGREAYYRLPLVPPTRDQKNLIKHALEELYTEMNLC